jgi:isoleucyl-tRNA synthetase
MTTHAPLDLKRTINLPQKILPMKANLVEAEPARLRRWKEMRLYERILDARRDRPLFILHDGPPYANGHIHIGHALNKILKDLIVKTRTMMGYQCPFIPGWDCHGLPIEIQVDEKLGRRKTELSVLEIRREARRLAEYYMRAQSEEFQRLGVFGDFEHPYYTMDPRYQAEIVRVLGTFIARGSVYKGLRVVHWCFHCQTALAEAEIEYEERTSPSIYVKFPLDSDPARIAPALAGTRVSILIWTTTPWTLPANLGIAVNPNFDYSAVAVGEEVYIVATELLPRVAEKLRWGDARTLATVKGWTLDRLQARHPFLERRSVLMLGDHVTLEAGTGCVHTAPGHGYEDYVLGQRYGLDIYSPVDAQGRFTPDVERFAGMHVFEANGPIIAHLREVGMLLAAEEIVHAYPHCWRCHNPVIFRATPQWFISMEKTGLRQRALEAIERVHWIPRWGLERMRNAIRTRPDWCISRQRAWGVPITVFYCQRCEAIVADPELIEHIAGIIEREGADVWYEREPEYFLPDGTRCPQCGGTTFRKETDILDVWLDSGTSHLAVLERRGLPWPADIYLEGGDQFRGWFNSSLLVALEVKGAPPYRTVITSGWTVDAEGQKMSKSKGNVIEPQEVIARSGAEILRLWVASSDYHEDVRISEEILTRLIDAYRKIRNTACYLVNNLYDFDPATDAVPDEEMEELDRWILAELNQLIRKVLAAYEAYEFHLAYHALYTFCASELSAIYFDIVKDRLYTFAPKSRGRRSAQTALFRLLDALTRLIAPILAFTADEIWEVMPGSARRELPSVHMAEFPKAEERPGEAELLARWHRLLEVRDRVLKALEEKRAEKLIGASLEAKVTLTAGGELYDFLASFGEQLRAVFIVSQVELRPGDAAELTVAVARADGRKCERCWTYSPTVGESARYPTVCARCVAVLQELEAEWNHARLP